MAFLAALGAIGTPGAIGGASLGSALSVGGATTALAGGAAVPAAIGISGAGAALSGALAAASTPSLLAGVGGGLATAGAFVKSNAGALTGAAAGGLQFAGGIARQNILEAQVDAQNQSLAAAAQFNRQSIRRSSDEDLRRLRLRSRARSAALEGKIASSGFTRSGTALSLVSDELIEQELREATLLGNRGDALERVRLQSTPIPKPGRGILFESALSSVAQGLTISHVLSS